MNKVILIGRLTRDPDISDTQNGIVARYSLAVDRKYKKDGGQEADFPNCVCFGKTAEFAQKYLAKGKKVAIVGRIQTGSYTNKDGVKIYTTDVVVEEHDFAESKNASQGGGGSAAPASSESADDFMSLADDIDEEMPFN